MSTTAPIASPEQRHHYLMIALIAMAAAVVAVLVVGGLMMSGNDSTSIVPTNNQPVLPTYETPDWWKPEMTNPTHYLPTYRSGVQYQ